MFSDMHALPFNFSDNSADLVLEAHSSGSPDLEALLGISL